MHDLLKFRYFFALLFLLSCGDAKKNDKPSITESKIEKEQNLSTGKKVILFFGDSLTAGYGLELEEAFPALIQKRLDSLNLPYTTINSGISGETTTGGLNRLDWVITQKIDVFVLELGANDGLRGIPLNETRSNLQSIIASIKKKNPETKIILAGMQIPPNMGPRYTQEFRQLFLDLAEENNLPLIPFLLENVAGNPDLNLEDGIHPTAEGHKIVMENVWKVLNKVIE